MKYIIITESVILPIMISIKAVILHRNGIKAIRLVRPDKNISALVFMIFCFAYAMLSGVLNLPFPSAAVKPFWDIEILNVVAVMICTTSLIWFGITLKVFGNSFRIGIDEKTNNKLMTSGTFALSRNPVFIAFIGFFLGFFSAFSNMVTSAFLILLIIMIHIQILKEEIFLENHYGEEYKHYRKKVRRYI